MTHDKNSNYFHILLYLIIFSCLIFAGFKYVQYQENYPSTDDAYVHGHIIYIAPQINGQITHVYVDDFEFVTQGQKIAKINPASYQAIYDQANAKLAQVTASNLSVNDAIEAANAQVQSASANLNDIQKKYDREIKLVKSGVLSKQTGDDLRAELTNAKNELNAAQAKVNQLITEQGATGQAAPVVKEAMAALTQANLNLSYTDIYAPVSGRLGKVSIQEGSIVIAGQALMPLVEANSFWIQANYKENAIGKIAPGMSAKVTLDMYPDMTFEGKVDAISPASGSSFSLLPPENATGNWVKVPQRFPVRLSFVVPHNGPEIRVGSSGTVKIDSLSHKTPPKSQNDSN